MSDLDAYGHLTWTVGNDDWIACFDARRTPEGIEYHVVVDCESGGFVDTLEHRTVPATEDGIRALLALPDYWAGLCMEHYPPGTRGHGRVTWRKTARSWERHIRSLLREPAPAEDEGVEEWWDERTLRSWRP